MAKAILNSRLNNRSIGIISNDYKRIVSDKSNKEYSIGLIDNNIYIWQVVIMGPKDTPYEYGIYKAEMTFPQDYPDAPPTFRFVTEMWHPNIDTNGNVCISILHKPGIDEFEYEDMNERWLPVRSPESIIMSIICLLSSPNCESPANIHAAAQYRNDISEFRKKVLRLAQMTLDFDY